VGFIPKDGTEAGGPSVPPAPPGRVMQAAHDAFGRRFTVGDRVYVVKGPNINRRATVLDLAQVGREWAAAVALEGGFVRVEAARSLQLWGRNA
jgi:hypothetical protein